MHRAFTRDTRVAASYVLEARYELLKLQRLPAFAIPTIAFPVLFYLFFGIAVSGTRLTGGRDVAGYLLATYGAFGVIGAGLFAFGLGVAVERAQGWLLVKRASPMPPAVYLFGKVAASMAFAAIIVTLLAVCAAALGGVRLTPARWILLSVTLVFGTIPFCAIGLAIGSAARPNSAPAIVNLLHFPMALASGLWIPLDLLPGVMANVAPSLPQYHLGQLALTITGGPSDPRTGVHLLALVLWTGVALVAAALAYRRDEGAVYG
jgi:ABC-2 type transport system permease protein